MLLLNLRLVLEKPWQFSLQLLLGCVLTLSEPTPNLEKSSTIIEVINEYKKLNPVGLTMSILGSRSKFCNNQAARDSADSLRQNTGTENPSCSFFQGNTFSMLTIPTLHDIACSHNGMQEIFETAYINFCPYSNIEDFACDVGSFELEVNTLNLLEAEVNNMMLVKLRNHIQRTLSPIDAFSSELGIQFDTVFVAPHVINVAQQVWAGAIVNVPNYQDLKVTYENAQRISVQGMPWKTYAPLYHVALYSSFLALICWTNSVLVGDKLKDGISSNQKRIFLLVAEGIDFKDDMPRAVQAFRAINQAAGGCIRHKYDYGAIILLDARYDEERSRMFASEWFRNSIRKYTDFKSSLSDLASFFKNAKNQAMLGVRNETVREESLSSSSKVISTAFFVLVLEGKTFSWMCG
ncbi:unnamed protein product [Arabis nemorensis]|uniref:ATP-dependent helicase C-terminal domain-containing protein n=1 Tax=Arabis nemorensis TaxID=586526 RepID=A0A565AYY1_9BRAS|nr:unnamed protein product [Arabis nemorensis]